MKPIYKYRTKKSMTPVIMALKGAKLPVEVESETDIPQKEGSVYIFSTRPQLSASKCDALTIIICQLIKWFKV